MSPPDDAQPDELAFLRLERDAALEHVVVKDEFIAHLQSQVEGLRAQCAALQGQADVLERMRAAARRVPGGRLVARTARRLLG